MGRTNGDTALLELSAIAAKSVSHAEGLRLLHPGASHPELALVIATGIVGQVSHLVTNDDQCAATAAAAPPSRSTCSDDADRAEATGAVPANRARRRRRPPDMVCAR